MELIDHIAAQGFCGDAFRSYLDVVPTAEAALDRLDAISAGR